MRTRAIAKSHCKRINVEALVAFVVVVLSNILFTELRARVFSGFSNGVKTTSSLDENTKLRRF